jgi:hypothetical protein
MEDFDLTFHWSARTEPHPFDTEDYSDASPTFIALEKFLSEHDGSFTIQIGSLELRFDLDPDLSTVFESIPSVLNAVSKAAIDGTTSELHFFEQGSGIEIELEKHGEALWLSIQKGSTVGQRFRNLPDGTYPVSRRLFAEKWARFIDAVLRQIAASSPAVLDDPSYVAQQTAVEAARQG